MNLETPFQFVFLLDGLLEIGSLFFETGEGAVALPRTIRERALIGFKRKRYHLGLTNKSQTERMAFLSQPRETFWQSLQRNNESVWTIAGSPSLKVGKLIESLAASLMVTGGILAFIVAIITTFVALFIL